MQRSPLIVGLMGVFAGMTALLVIVGIAIGSVFVSLVAVPFAIATYIFWQHASGRLREQIHREARARARESPRDGDRGGFGAGPRFGRRTRTNARFQQSRAGEQTRQGQRIDPNAPTGLTRAEASDTLGVSPDADEATVKAAYREAVKEKHPDRGGDEEEFKAVAEAYDRLTE